MMLMLFYTSANSGVHTKQVTVDFLKYSRSCKVDGRKYKCPSAALYAYLLRMVFAHFIPRTENVITYRLLNHD